ncbi:hypothetical protein N658DRAFT_112639 [Parathielavia hyrcaniae]|uniref:HBS1-like protein N-terminal domain-containing protein n=1 Tax=Parathielavia hyrcaniae TaxID=113614 RepID=A0AAN6Q7U9_9PEZI|nr:hypothetical protein N658DRAFT_112639 [Parathielavia hyrcaniae]
MSRHQYVRNLDYKDALDEYEGYSEEEDELSPEDRALLNQGTADVQAALGVEASKVTVAQIEEALWHYYYDVDRSVAYLTAKFINPPPKAVKPPTRQPTGKSVTCAVDTAAADVALELDAPVYWARKYLDANEAGIPAPQLSPTSYLLMRETELPAASWHVAGAAALARPAPSISNLFQDMPWGNIPRHREAALVPPLIPRGGLLGGSGTPPKMSKLQALAAARKKKAEERAADDNKLKVVEMPTGKENVLPSAPSKQFKRLRIAESAPRDRIVSTMAPSVPQPQPAKSGAQERSNMASSTPQDEPLPKAKPSAFARVLCGLPDEKPKPKPPMEEETPLDPSLFGKRYGPDNKGTPPTEPFDSTWWFDIRKRKRSEDDSDGYEEEVVLYPNLPQFAKDNFAQPSPDDIVLAAQAKAKPKGSLLKKSKR